jgi:tetratricopeptide (TPR) repeat protein
MGLGYGLRSASTWGWAGILLIVTILGTARWSWASQAGEKLGLRDVADPTLLYSDESQYSSIRVYRSSDEGDIRQFMLDTLMHSEIDMHSPFNFQYSYEKVYAAVTKRLFRGRDRVDNLTIGGGGYVYPRYMEATWPSGRTEVAEIDPAVTEAAKAAFGMPRDSKIVCHDEDGRVMIDRLVQRRKSGEQVEPFDVIYCDAVNDYSVPFQLTTIEFMRMVEGLIAPGGAYIVNMIDVYDTGLLLSAMYNTMREVFPHVYVLLEGVPLSEIHEDRNTFVLVGVRGEIDVAELGPEYEKDCNVYPLTSDQLLELSNKTKGLVLRDDFCPVENLLAPVVLRSTAERAYEDWCRRGRKLMLKREFAEAAECFQEAVEAYPSRRSVAALNDLGRALTEQGRVREANESYQRAIQMDAAFPIAHLNLAENLLAAGKRAEAVASMLKGLAAGSGSMGVVFTAASLFQRAGELERATICYEEVVKLDPGSSDARNNLATVLAAQGKLAEAAEHLQRGIRRDSGSVDMHFNLGQILLRMGQTNEAITAYRSALKLDPRHLDARSGLATALATMNQLDPAITELSEVVRIAPNMLDAHFNLAAMLEQKGRLDEALHHYQEVLRIDPADAAAAQAVTRLQTKGGKS